ncbi:hypothetical protein DACRYDRAFT_99186 [Dacryopinax primogenitus]|uniref:RRM domain-containing protein n=1 Tax=Dacryopinax primogenitus (strain DJM 731) TaxID=1858805 RepID=M5GET7_DACPD|nr:uncharacterized protein DACRYDRAFT_99186 [Dacryopinax primogenitus]EJU03578.1 hypothetical protein DACRYDRAFT_99186 [Dacryopinax primogenitus]
MHSLISAVRLTRRIPAIHKSLLIHRPSARFMGNVSPAQSLAAAETSSKNRRVFVLNLPYTATMDKVKEFMETRAGPVTHAEILTTPEGESKGCAVVEFEGQEMAEKAIASISMQVFDGRSVFVRPVGHDLVVGERDRKMNETEWQDQSDMGFGTQPYQLYIGNVPPSFSWQDLKDVFKPFGPVNHCNVSSKRVASATEPIWGTLQLQSAAHAQRAMNHFADAARKSSIGALVVLPWEDRPRDVDVSLLNDAARRSLRPNKGDGSAPAPAWGGPVTSQAGQVGQPRQPYGFAQPGQATFSAPGRFPPGQVQQLPQQPQQEQQHSPGQAQPLPNTWSNYPYPYPYAYPPPPSSLGQGWPSPAGTPPPGTPPQNAYPAPPQGWPSHPPQGYPPYQVPYPYNYTYPPSPVTTPSPDSSSSATPSPDSAIPPPVEQEKNIWKAPTGPRAAPELFRHRTALHTGAKTQIVVKFFPNETDEEDLVDLFTSTGAQVVGVEILRTERIRNMGIVQFSTPDEAQAAVQTFHGYNYGGRGLALRMVNEPFNFSAKAWAPDREKLVEEEREKSWKDME